MATQPETSLVYAPPARWIHWLTVPFILLAIPAGIAMKNVGQGGLQDWLYDFHRSLGTCVLVLAILRVLIKIKVGSIPAHPTLAALQRIVATAVHHLLYVFVLVVPLLGWAGTSAYGAKIIVFGLFELPPILAQDQPLGEAILWWHGSAAIVLTLLVGMHIGAALMHGFILKDGVLQRMLPSWPR